MSSPTLRPAGPARPIRLAAAQPEGLPAAVPGIVPGMDDDPLTMLYRTEVERIARYPVTDSAARAAILAEIEQL